MCMTTCEVDDIPATAAWCWRIVLVTCFYKSHAELQFCVMHAWRPLMPVEICMQMVRN